MESEVPLSMDECDMHCVENGEDFASVRRLKERLFALFIFVFFIFLIFGSSGLMWYFGNRDIKPSLKIAVFTASMQMAQQMQSRMELMTNFTLRLANNCEKSDFISAFDETSSVISNDRVMLWALSTASQNSAARAFGFASRSTYYRIQVDGSVTEQRNGMQCANSFSINTITGDRLDPMNSNADCTLSAQTNLLSAASGTNLLQYLHMGQDSVALVVPPSAGSTRVWFLEMKLTNFNDTSGIDKLFLGKRSSGGRLTLGNVLFPNAEKSGVVFLTDGQMNRLPGTHSDEASESVWTNVVRQNLNATATPTVWGGGEFWFQDLVGIVCSVRLHRSNIRVVVGLETPINDVFKNTTIFMAVLWTLGFIVAAFQAQLSISRLRNFQVSVSLRPLLLQLAHANGFSEVTRVETAAALVFVGIFSAISATLWVSFRFELAMNLSRTHLNRISGTSLVGIGGSMNETVIAQLLGRELQFQFDRSPCATLNGSATASLPCWDGVNISPMIKASVLNLISTFEFEGNISIITPNDIFAVERYRNTSLVSCSGSLCGDLLIREKRRIFIEANTSAVTTPTFLPAYQSTRWIGYILPHVTPIVKRSVSSVVSSGLVAVVLLEMDLSRLLGDALAQGTYVDGLVNIDEKNDTNSTAEAPAYAYIFESQGFVLGWDSPNSTIVNVATFGRRTDILPPYAPVAANKSDEAPAYIVGAAKTLQYLSEYPANFTDYLDAHLDTGNNTYIAGTAYKPSILLTPLSGISVGIPSDWKMCCMLPFWSAWSPVFSHQIFSLAVSLVLITFFVSGFAFNICARSVFPLNRRLLDHDHGHGHGHAAGDTEDELSSVFLQTATTNTVAATDTIKINDQLLNLAVLHVDNAYAERPLRRKGLHSRPLRIFRLVNSNIYIRITTALLIVNLAFIFFEEEPAFMQQTDKTVLAFEFVCVSLLAVDTLFFTYDQHHNAYAKKHFKLIPIIIFVMIIELLVALGLDGKSARLSRFLRPILVLLRNRDVRGVAERVVVAMFRTGDMLILLLMFVICSTVIGIILFKDLYRFSDNPYGFFNVADGLIMQFNIMNTEALPNVLSMISTDKQLKWRWVVVTFLVFFFVFSFLFFVPALIALFNQSFQKSTLMALKKRRRNQIVNLLAAFDILDDRGEGTLTRQQFQTCMTAFLQRSVASENLRNWATKLAMAKFQEIDIDRSGTLDKLEFCDVFRRLKDAIDNSVDTGQNVSDLQKWLLHLFFKSDEKSSRPTDFSPNYSVSRVIILVVMGQMIFNTSFGDIYLFMYAGTWKRMDTWSTPDHDLFDVKMLVNGLLVLFQVFELIIKLIVWSPRGFYRLGAFNRLDFLIISISAICSLVSLGVGSTQVVTKITFALPALRVFTIIQSSNFLLTAFISVLKSIGSVALVMFLLMYFYAVIGMTAFGNWNYNDVHPIYPDSDFDETFGRTHGFNGPDVAFLTLFQLLFGSGYKLAAFPIAESTNWFIHAFFVSYCFFSNMLILNLVVSVVLDAFQFRLSVSNMIENDKILMKRINLNPERFCILCEQAFTDTDSICHMPCRDHKFHTSCLLHYPYDRGTCPFCRIIDIANGIRHNYSGKADELMFREVVFHEVSVPQIEKQEAKELELARSEAEALFGMPIAPSLERPWSQAQSQRWRSSVLRDDILAAPPVASAMKLATLQHKFTSLLFLTDNLSDPTRRPGVEVGPRAQPLVAFETGGARGGEGRRQSDSPEEGGGGGGERRRTLSRDKDDGAGVLLPPPEGRPPSPLLRRRNSNPQKDEPRRISRVKLFLDSSSDNGIRPPGGDEESASSAFSHYEDPSPSGTTLMFSGPHSGHFSGTTSSRNTPPTTTRQVVPGEIEEWEEIQPVSERWC